jgi:hypothetical protein
LTKQDHRLSLLYLFIEFLKLCFKIIDFSLIERNKEFLLFLTTTDPAYGKSAWSPQSSPASPGKLALRENIALKVERKLQEIV